MVALRRWPAHAQVVFACEGAGRGDQNRRAALKIQSKVQTVSRQPIPAADFEKKLENVVVSAT